MAVSLWAVLGVCLTLLGLPFLFFVTNGEITGGLAVGAGVAFLIVAVTRWIMERDDPAPDPDLESHTA